MVGAGSEWPPKPYPARAARPLTTGHQPWKGSGPRPEGKGFPLRARPPSPSGIWSPEALESAPAEQNGERTPGRDLRHDSRRRRRGKPGTPARNSQAPGTWSPSNPLNTSVLSGTHRTGAQRSTDRCAPVRALALSHATHPSTRRARAPRREAGRIRRVAHAGPVRADP